MSPRVPIRLLTFGLLLVAVLDVLFAQLDWTHVAVGLTALAIGLPLAYLMHEIRQTMASYGMSDWEFVPTRPFRLPVAASSAVPRPVAAPRAASPWLPGAAAAVGRVAVSLLISTSVVALRTVVAFETMLQ